MVELIAKSPLKDLLPITIGNVTLTERAPEKIMSVTPFPGQQNAASQELESQIGQGLSAVGHMSSEKGKHVVWAGLDQWFVVAEDLPDLAGALQGKAAVTDQSDGWCEVILSGPDSEAVLARLCPLDLSEQAFAPDAAARTQIAHLMSLLTRGDDGFQFMVMRSFARDLVRHIKEAAQKVTARQNA